MFSSIFFLVMLLLFVVGVHVCVYLMCPAQMCNTMLCRLVERRTDKRDGRMDGQTERAAWKPG